MNPSLMTTETLIAFILFWAAKAFGLIGAGLSFAVNAGSDFIHFIGGAFLLAGVACILSSLGLATFSFFKERKTLVAENNEQYQINKLRQAKEILKNELRDLQYSKETKTFLTRLR